MSKLIQVQATTTGTYVDGSGNLVTVTGVISDATTAVEPSSLTITDRHTMTIVYPFNVITNGSVVGDWDSNADVPDAVALTAANIELSYTSPIWFYDDTGKDCTYTKASAIVLGDDSHATSFTDTAVTNSLVGQYLNYFDSSVSSYITVPTITLSGDFYIKIYLTIGLNEYLLTGGDTNNRIYTTTGGEIGGSINNSGFTSSGASLAADGDLHFIELTRTSDTFTIKFDGTQYYSATRSGNFVTTEIGRSHTPSQYYDGFIKSITFWNNATGAGTAVREYLMSTDLSVAGDPITVPDTGSDGSDGSAYNISSTANTTEQYTLNTVPATDQYENRYWPNQLKYSNDPTNSPWTYVRLASATNGDIIANTDNLSHYYYNANGLLPVAATQYETLVIAKQGDQPMIKVFMHVVGANSAQIYGIFDLTDGTLDSSGETAYGNLIGTPTIVASTEHSGYYECRVVWTIDAGYTTGNVFMPKVMPVPSGATEAFIGDDETVNTYVKNVQISTLADADMVTTTDTTGKAIVVAY